MKRMKRRRLVFYLLIFLWVVFQGGAVAVAEDLPMHRLVIQVSDDNPRTMRIALNNAINVIKAVGQDNIKVEIVAYGPGLKLLEERNETFRDRVISLQFYGIRFVACGNTMETLKLSKKELVNGVEVVKAGVLEIMKRQEEGWSYVRP